MGNCFLHFQLLWQYLYCSIPNIFKMRLSSRFSQFLMTIMLPTPSLNKIFSCASGPSRLQKYRCFHLKFKNKKKMNWRLKQKRRRANSNQYSAASHSSLARWRSGEEWQRILEQTFIRYCILFNMFLFLSYINSFLQSTYHWMKLEPQNTNLVFII